MSSRCSVEGRGHEKTLRWTECVEIEEILKQIAKEFPDSKPSDMTLRAFVPSWCSGTYIVVQRKPEYYDSGNAHFSSGRVVMYKGQQALVVSVAEKVPEGQVPIVSTEDWKDYRHRFVPIGELSHLPPQPAYAG